MQWMTVYGFCGATKGYLPYGRMIAESITAIGREQLLLSKAIAESPPFNMRVIYGDTDSIMFTHARVNEEYLSETAGDRLLVVRSGTPADVAAVAARLIEEGYDTWAGFKARAAALAAVDPGMAAAVRACVRWAGQDALQFLKDQAEEIGRVVSERIGRPPMSLEFEALFDNYRQYAKKRCG